MSERAVRAELTIVRRLIRNERVARYRNSLLSRAWGVLLPVMESGVFALVFGMLADWRGSRRAYLAFVFVGVLAWRAFARAVAAGTTALPRQAALLHSFPVRTRSVTLAAALQALGESLFVIPVLLTVIGLATGFALSLQTFGWLTLGLVLHLGFTFALAFLLAPLNALYRDVGLAINPLLSLLMFAAPVVYPLSALPERWRAIMLINPVAAAIECFRTLLPGHAPPPAVPLLVAGAVTVVLLAAGLAASLAFEHRVREVL